jgi:capsular polysaccharide export protein
MRSLSETAELFPRRATAPGAAPAALFPELAEGPVAAWAGERGATRKRARAAAAGVPFVLLAEGLLRAPRRGHRPRPWLSMLAGEIAGPASPADRLSRERVLAERGWEDSALLAAAATARAALAAARIAGAWWQSGGEAALPAGGGHAVVGLSDSPVPPARPVVAAMLDAAFSENPGGRVIILAPTGSARRQRALLAEAARRDAVVIDRPCDPWAVLERAGRVYSAGGELGFLALVAGTPVAAFADAFYTGWGATEDAPGVGQHPFRRTADEIFAGACLVATRYRDPFRDHPASFAETLALLADWRRIEEANRRIAACVGMSFWKRRRIADFLASSAGAPGFRRSAARAIAAARRLGDDEPGAVAGWASRLPRGLAERAAREGVKLWRVEDGFIRSVGLGSDFLPPASLVVDRRGMYFDPRRESDLEILLREDDFPPALVARAGRLAARLVARGVTKYNLAGHGAALDLPSGRRRILVPGQVEDDLSILFGSGAIRSNLALLEAVRSANPDAFILYKPHPDVVAGHRKGRVGEPEARRFADLVVAQAATAALLDRIDELHTMTSLAGFEALLRGRHVVVYGRPFYAGWGLTEDRPPFDRGRRLSLAELVAGALILYPRYLDPLTRLPCGPEVVIERLDHPELWRPGPLVLARRLQGALARRLGEVGALRAAAGPGPLRGLGERPPS